MTEQTPTSSVSVDDDHMSASGIQIAALFAAPASPDDALASWQQAAQVSEADLNAEAELARLRLMPVNEMVLEYLGHRDRLDEERHAYNALEREIKGKLEMMSMVMREKADALGVDAFPIRGVGTAYRNQKTSYRVGDWSLFSQWVIDTNNLQCLEKRVAKLATVEVEKTTGAVPPGIQKEVEVEFLVRRNKA